MNEENIIIDRKIVIEKIPLSIKKAFELGWRPTESYSKLVSVGSWKCDLCQEVEVEKHRYYQSYKSNKSISVCRDCDQIFENWSKNKLL